MLPVSDVSLSTVITNVKDQNSTIAKQETTSESTSTCLENGEGIWCQLGREYDIHNITHEQRAELSQKLYDAGEISLLDHAVLSFDGERIFPDGSTFLTESTSSGAYDLVAEFTARVDLNKQMSDQQSMENNQRILDILSHLESASNEPIDIVA